MTTPIDNLPTVVHDVLSKWRSAEIPEAIERYSKALVTLAGLLYVIGLVVSVRYYASLHVRSLELLRSQYVLIGVWYFVVLVLHLGIPALLLRRQWLRTLYLLVGLVVVVLYNHAFSIYLQTLLQRAFGWKTYFEFGPAEASVLKGNLVVLAVSWVFALLSAWLGLWLLVKHKSKWGIVLIAYALWLNFGVFADHVFANMPQTIGGGEPPIAQLQFADSVPEHMKEDFDVSKQLEGNEGNNLPWYYARIVYADEHSIFLKPTFWYATDVYEFPRDQVGTLAYRNFNPLAFGSPRRRR